ncbi:Hypothetical predicted protein [Mytilus galloprovincialis]|uniref:Uncharacterized protein n=1 Tax=Mytilus galloprovincialis TaxID=29158 RepID=A0A8B6BTT1_MYTGA|nr:Hypothetical predicted protein [Mytilus galloprovincialis]
MRTTKPSPVNIWIAGQIQNPVGTQLSERDLVDYGVEGNIVAANLMADGRPMNIAINDQRIMRADFNRTDSVNPDIIFGTGTWVDDKIIEMAEESTRESNTLDLIITNYPNSFIRVETIPGISDHDIVFEELKTIPSQQTQKPRKISLYKKAK